MASCDPRQRGFRFEDLPVELGLEIIRIASAPHATSGPGSFNRLPYKTASALCRVSFQFRAVTMPHLLRSVLLPDTCHVLAFQVALIMQQYHGMHNSRLELEYEKIVQRMWIGNCRRASDSVLAMAPPINYTILLRFMSYIPSLGFTGWSCHLLEQSANPNWRCTRLTLGQAGWPREWTIRPAWSSAWSTSDLSSLGGFLKKISHLVLWTAESSGLGEQQPLIPSWIRLMPLSDMAALTHLAIPIYRRTTPCHGLCAPTDMLVYRLSPSQPPYILKDWVQSEAPLTCGVVIPLPCPPMSWHATPHPTGEVVFDWAGTWLQGYDDLLFM